VVVTRHEQAAGFMAATYGATNLVTAAAHASLGGMPMLMITGQKPILQSRQSGWDGADRRSSSGPASPQRSPAWALITPSRRRRP